MLFTQQVPSLMLMTHNDSHVHSCTVHRVAEAAATSREAITEAVIIMIIFYLTLH